MIEGEIVVHCHHGKAVSLGYIISRLHVFRATRARDRRPDAPAMRI